jgi:hypothetical protein
VINNADMMRRSLLLQPDFSAMAFSRSSCPSAPCPPSSAMISSSSVLLQSGVSGDLWQFSMRIRSRARMRNSWVCHLLLTLFGLALLENATAKTTRSTQNTPRGFLISSKEMTRMEMMLPVAVNPVSIHQQLQQAVFKGFAHNKTGIPFPVTLPAQLSNITVQAVRLRTRKLRSRGFAFNEFHFPVGFMVGNSSIVRVMMVYQDFGKFAVYSPPAGKSFSSKVLGMMIYDASDLNNTHPQLPLSMTSAKPITVIFAVNATVQPSSELLCASYSTTGLTTTTTVSNVDPGTEEQCSFTQLGSFALLEPQQQQAASSVHHHHHQAKALKIILGTIFGSIAIIAILLLFVVALWRTEHERHFARMQYYSDQGETLQHSLIGNSRAPAAGSTRTRPTLENLD